MPVIPSESHSYLAGVTRAEHGLSIGYSYFCASEKKLEEKIGGNWLSTPIPGKLCVPNKLPFSLHICQSFQWHVSMRRGHFVFRGRENDYYQSHPIDPAHKKATAGGNGQNITHLEFQFSWWRHGMETITALLALCEGNPPVTGGFPSRRVSNWERWRFLCR